jgi:hypothetical protein
MVRCAVVITVTHLRAMRASAQAHVLIIMNAVHYGSVIITLCIFFCCEQGAASIGTSLQVNTTAYCTSNRSDMLLLVILIRCSRLVNAITCVVLGHCYSY